MLLLPGSLDFHQYTGMCKSPSPWHLFCGWHLPRAPLGSGWMPLSSGDLGGKCQSQCFHLWWSVRSWWDKTVWPTTSQIFHCISVRLSCCLARVAMLWISLISSTFPVFSETLYHLPVGIGTDHGSNLLFSLWSHSPLLVIQFELFLRCIMIVYFIEVSGQQGLTISSCSGLHNEEDLQPDSLCWARPEWRAVLTHKIYLCKQ